MITTVLNGVNGPYLLAKYRTNRWLLYGRQDPLYDPGFCGVAHALLQDKTCFVWGAPEIDGSTVPVQISRLCLSALSLDRDVFAARLTVSREIE